MVLLGHLGFFFCLVTCFHESFQLKDSKDGHACDILSPAKCPCHCKEYVTFNPQTWYEAFLSSIKKPKCKCKDCRKEKKVKCHNGVCDVKGKKCVCDYCWVGEVCDKFSNKHAPAFDTTAVEVSITKSHPRNIPITTVTAYDRDAEFCNGSNCPCGTVVYKLHKGRTDMFKIDRSSGSISLRKAPDTFRYVLSVVASNEVEGSMEENVNVTILITDIPPPQVYLEADDAEDDEGVEEGEYDANKPRHRFRRAIESKVNHPLVISAEPTLAKVYYFNKGETIKFTVKAKNNGSKEISNIDLTVSSSWLTLKNAVKGSFLSVSELVFKQRKLAANKEVSGQLIGEVKAGIGPLANLNLDLTSNYVYDATNMKLSGVKSAPIVYGVFPQVNITRNTSAVSTYGYMSVEMSMNLPLLNYHLLVELTTNVECFVFMEVKNVRVQKGGSITGTGSATPVYHKSENSNGLVDRVIVDFGNITVLGDDRSIKIDYVIGVKDHANVANGSTHYAGAGLQAGPSVLWVDQQAIQITKTEPALELTYDKTLINNSSRLFIGDKINISYRVEHTSTSEDAAKDVRIYLVAEHLVPQANAGGIEKVNSTLFMYSGSGQTLTKGSVIRGEFAMVVNASVAPLINLPLQLVVEYKNAKGQQKFPLKLPVPVPMTGTPNFTFKRVEGNENVVFNNRMTFELTISLTKMRSPIQVEFVTPKVIGKTVNGSALMHILSCDLVSVGANIKDENGVGMKGTITSKPLYLSTSDESRWNDQVVWALGVAVNTAADVSNAEDNQIKLRFDVIVNEVQGVTNGQRFVVGAGVVAQPRMVWIGQLNQTVYIRSNRQPKMQFSHSIGNGDNTYEHRVQFNHSSESNQYAYNVTFEYFLPPYIKFVEETSKKPDIVPVNIPGGRTRFRFTKMMTFLDRFNHSILVAVNRTLSPKTGIFNYMVPVALTYTNYEHKRWQYWRSITRSIHVRSRSPIILRKSDAHSNYYGRGFYVKGNEIFLCMNQHVPTSRQACYRSTDNGKGWRAMDSRVGSVMGHIDNQLYAVGRNQVVMVRYDENDRDWYLLSEREKKDLAVKFAEAKKKIMDCTEIKTLQTSEISDAHTVASHNGGKYGATDEWVYFQKQNDNKWNKIAKWRL